MEVIARIAYPYCSILFNSICLWLHWKENMKHHKSTNERTAFHVCPSTLHSGLTRRPGVRQSPLRKGCKCVRSVWRCGQNLWPIDVYPTSGMSFSLGPAAYRTDRSDLYLRVDYQTQWLCSWLQWLPHEKCWIKRLSLEYDVEKVINVKRVHSFPSFPGTWSIQSKRKKEKKVQESLRRNSQLDKKGKTEKSRRVTEETFSGFVSIHVQIPSSNQFEIYWWTKSCTTTNVFFCHCDLSVITFQFIIHWPVI